MQDVKANTLI